MYSEGDAVVVGDLEVTGTISGAGSAETGTVALDGDGTATVVPVTIDNTGADYDYQLTAIGAAMPNLHLVEHGDGRFRVAGGKPGGAVSWQRTSEPTRPPFDASKPKPKPSPKTCRSPANDGGGNTELPIGPMAALGVTR